MKRGFTILELLVASLLLGMLITILTMIFNQSSIAWRTGVAGVADLDDVRANVAEVRDEADNAYPWNREMHRLIGLWDNTGKLRTRAWDVGSEQNNDTSAGFLKAKGPNVSDEGVKPEDVKILSVGSGASGTRIKTYSVNVKSAGPDAEFDTWDDVWSYPDEIN